MSGRTPALLIKLRAVRRRSCSVQCGTSASFLSKSALAFENELKVGSPALCQRARRRPRKLPGNTYGLPTADFGALNGRTAARSAASVASNFGGSMSKRLAAFETASAARKWSSPRCPSRALSWVRATVSVSFANVSYNCKHADHDCRKQDRDDNRRAAFGRCNSQRHKREEQRSSTSIQRPLGQQPPERLAMLLLRVRPGLRPESHSCKR